jgi:hypothetical protein
MTKIGPLLIGIATATFIAMLPSPTKAVGTARGSVKVTINGAHISIDYGRPELRGRDMLRQIHPGQLWHIGADAPATLVSDKELSFGGTIVPRGKHTLMARLVTPGRWTLVFSSPSGTQTRPSVKYIETPATLQETSDSIESVTIQLTDKGGTGFIEIAWGRMRLSASFTPA